MDLVSPGQVGNIDPVMADDLLQAHTMMGSSRNPRWALWSKWVYGKILKDAARREYVSDMVTG